MCGTHPRSRQGHAAARSAGEFDDPEIREFYFGHQDAYRLISNLDYGCDLFPPKRSLRSETADFQRGEVEIDGRNLYFDEWDHKFEFDVEPVESK